jgi:hypothetical protein
MFIIEPWEPHTETDTLLIKTFRVRNEICRVEFGIPLRRDSSENSALMFVDTSIIRLLLRTFKKCIFTKRILLENSA